MINDIINKAKQRARRIAETQYEDTCTVTERTTQRNKINKRTELVETQPLIDQPCKLTFKETTLVESKESSTTSSVVQEILLFISPDVSIKPGSRIEITRKNGAVEVYKNSGKPQVYDTHQEIVLEIFKGWA